MFYFLLQAVRDGAWNVAGSGMLLQDPQAMEHWGYINLRPDQISMEEFQAKMMELCNRCGGLGACNSTESGTKFLLTREGRHEGTAAVVSAARQSPVPHWCEVSS